MAGQHPDWALGFADETWWSRLAQPQLHSWVDPQVAEGPLRLVEQQAPKGDPDPKALACYGLLVRQLAQAERIWLRFVGGAARERHHGAVPGLVLRSTAGGRRARLDPDLG